MTNKSNNKDTGATLGSTPRKRVLADIPKVEPASYAPAAKPEGTFEVAPEAAPVPGLKGLSRENRKVTGVAPKSAAAASGDAPLLPPGGLVAMRRSGGLHFTSSTIVVFHDGRISAGGDLSQARGRLDDEQLAELYRALESAGLPDLPSTSGHQSPDAYAYEVVAHLSGKDYSVEAFDSGIPPQLAALVKVLVRYMDTAG